MPPQLEQSDQDCFKAEVARDPALKNTLSRLSTLMRIVTAGIVKTGKLYRLSTCLFACPCSLQCPGCPQKNRRPAFVLTYACPGTWHPPIYMPCTYRGTHSRLPTWHAHAHRRAHACVHSTARAATHTRSRLCAQALTGVFFPSISLFGGRGPGKGFVGYMAVQSAGVGEQGPRILLGDKGCGSAALLPHTCRGYN